MTDADAAPNEPAELPVPPSPTEGTHTSTRVEDSNRTNKDEIPIVSSSEEDDVAGPDESWESDSEEEEETSDEGEETSDEEDDGENSGEEDEELDASALLAFSKRRMKEIAAASAEAPPPIDETKETNDDADADDESEEDDTDDEADDESEEEDTDDESEEEDTDDESEEEDTDDESEEEDTDDESEVEGTSHGIDGAEVPAEEVITEEDAEVVVGQSDVRSGLSVENPSRSDVGGHDGVSDEKPVPEEKESEQTSGEVQPCHKNTVDTTASSAGQAPKEQAAKPVEAASSQPQETEEGSEKALRKNRNENADLYALLAYSKRRLETGTIPGASKGKKSLDKKEKRQDSMKSSRAKSQSSGLSKNPTGGAENEARNITKNEQEEEEVISVNAEEGGKKEGITVQEQNNWQEESAPCGDDEEKKDDSLVENAKEDQGGCPGDDKPELDPESDGEESVRSSEDEESEEEESDYSSGEDGDEGEFEDFDLDAGLDDDNDVDLAAVEAARLKASTLLSLADAADAVAKKPTHSTASPGGGDLSTLAETLGTSMKDMGASMEKMGASMKDMGSSMKDKGTVTMKDMSASMKDMGSSMTNLISPRSPRAMDLGGSETSSDAGSSGARTPGSRSLSEFHEATVRKLQTLQKQQKEAKETAAVVRQASKRWFRPSRGSSTRSTEEEPVFMDWNGVKIPLKKLEAMQKGSAKLRDLKVGQKGKGVLRSWAKGFVDACNKVDEMYDGNQV